MTVGPKHQIVIPKPLREMILNWKPGNAVEVLFV
mgnify:CR=1 FL=1